MPAVDSPSECPPRSNTSFEPGRASEHASQRTAAAVFFSVQRGHDHSAPPLAAGGTGVAQAFAAGAGAGAGAFAAGGGAGAGAFPAAVDGEKGCADGRNPVTRGSANEVTPTERIRAARISSSVTDALAAGRAFGGGGTRASAV